MLKTVVVFSVLALSVGGPLHAQDRISIASDWGSVTATLEENAATRTLVGMLPLTIDMRDLLSQEKIGRLPSALPSAKHQQSYSAGTLGLWNAQDFVIYYRAGELGPPGIVPLGQVTGDASIFDRPGSLTVTITHIKE
jgi:hypothetical protein